MRFRGLKSLLYLLPFSVCLVHAQTAAPAGQQIAVLKMLKPGLTTLGVLSSTIGEKQMENILRAAMGQNIHVVFGKPTNLREIVSVYRKMVSEKGIQLLWIPDAEDRLILDSGFDLLKESSLPDRIGISVPAVAHVADGALCCVLSENGKLTLHINQRTAQLIGATVPAPDNGTIACVVR